MPNYTTEQSGGASLEQGADFSGGTPGQFVVVGTGPTIGGTADWAQEYDAFRNLLTFSKNDVTKPAIIRIINTLLGAHFECRSGSGDTGLKFIQSSNPGYGLLMDISATGKPGVVCANDAAGSEPVAGTNDIVGFYHTQLLMEVITSFGIRPVVVGDAAKVVAATECLISFQTALTAPRAVTLPARSTVRAGTHVRVQSVNAINGVNVITVSPAGSDTINAGAGGAAFTAMAGAFGIQEFVATGTIGWIAEIKSIL